MQSVELRRHVTNRLVVLHLELGRLSDVRLAEAFRRDAAPYFAWACSWSSNPPTPTELSLVLITVDRLLAAVSVAKKAVRHADPCDATAPPAGRTTPAA